MLETELDRLGRLLAKVESEKAHRTADLRAQIEKIESEYANKERGLKKAIEGLEEATGRRLRLESAAETGHKPTTQDLIERVFRTNPGLPISATLLLQKVRDLGATFESPNPEKAIISSLYAVMDKFKKQGEKPILLIAPRTWVWNAAA
jgi:hypothetical protein